MSKPDLLAPAPLPSATIAPSAHLNGSQLPSNAPQASRRRTLRSTVAALLFVTAAVATGIFIYVRAPGVERTDLLYHKVRKEPLALTVVERGALESADNRDVICRVRAGSKASNLTIKWVIDDGALVRQGQLLVEIEDTALQDQLKVQRIALDTARSGMVQAEENLKIVQSQNASDIATQKVAVKLAEIDLEKYIKGDYEKEKKTSDSAIKLAESDLSLQQERVAYTKNMVKMRYLSAAQLQAEEAKRASLEVTLAKAIEERRVLDEYTRPRNETDFKNKVDQAKRDLETKSKQADSKESQAEMDRMTKKSIYDQELDKYIDIEDQIANCRIYAPQDGLVVYYVSEQSRWGAGSQQSIVAQGEPVKEGQRLMRIPNLTRMLVNTKVHDAMVTRVHGEVWRSTGFFEALRAGLLTQFDPVSRVAAQQAVLDMRDKFRDHALELVQAGQPATVRIDAFPSRVLKAHVKSVATVPAQQDWTSADVKMYQTMVAIDEEVEGCKPGMNAEVTVKVDGTSEPVLALPLQAIVGGAELGPRRKCFVRTGTGAVERDIVIGLANERMAEIRSGIAEGDEVVLNPKVLVGEHTKVHTAGEPERPSGGEGKKGKGKGGPGKGDAPKGPATAPKQKPPA